MVCPLCQKEIEYVDYLDIQLLEQFLNELGGIRSRRKTRLCRKHQRKVKQAIKQARYLALLPYVSR